MNDLLDKAWHDAILKEISIDRSNPGNRDTVRLVVEWPEWASPEDGACSLIEFEDCYRLDMNMNFGIIAEESILDVRLDPVNPAIAKIEKSFGVTGLISVVFEMNSTGSLIGIVAKSVRMAPIPCA